MGVSKHERYGEWRERRCRDKAARGQKDSNPMKDE